MKSSEIHEEDISLAESWGEALKIAAVFAVDPVGLKGVLLRSPAGAARDAWLQCLRHFLQPTIAIRRVPHQVSEARLLGGLDLAATLSSGRPIAEKGLLAECHGSVAIVAMAERMRSATAGLFSSALDCGTLAVERDGMSYRIDVAFGVVLLDEGVGDDEAAAPALTDRVAFHVKLPDAQPRQSVFDWEDTAVQIAAARSRLASLRMPDDAIEAMTAAGIALGVGGLRAPILALSAARAFAALHGRSELSDEDLQFAAGAVLAPRATRLPASATRDENPSATNEEDERDGNNATDSQPEQESQLDTDLGAATRTDTDNTKAAEASLADVVLEAAKAAIPAGLLVHLMQEGAIRMARSSGRSGRLQHGAKNGRPVGVEPGDPRAAGRLNLLATLRAAAPWQVLRRRESEIASRSGAPTASAPRIHICRDDFRVNRYQQRAETTTIFAVDASGSAALHRLAEAKGAVELLLADCYVRRDRVAVIAFRGRAAEILLPPTRSLVRAKRGLAALPGGGGTPLAAGIDAAGALAEAAKRRGETPLVVFLTDGRANVGRDGNGGRDRAEADALAAARVLRAAKFKALVIDTSAGGEQQAMAIADAMAGTYLRLPQSDARQLSSLVGRVASDLGRPHA